MEQYISKSVLVAEIEKRYNEYTSSILKHYDACKEAKAQELGKILTILDTLEVKEVNIAEMADEYYDALMKETDWMDEGTMGHCRLAYYTGCKDVLNKLQKGE